MEPIEKKFDLRLSLKKVGLSQRDFAKLCGVHPTTVNRWCRGGIRVPKYAEMVFTMELRGIDLEKEVRKLVEEGYLFEGMKVNNCPNYQNVWELIQELKIISSKPISIGD